MNMNHLAVATWISELLDNQFKVGKFGVGLEPVISLIPVVGDVITLGLSLYMLWIAHDMGAPQNIRNKMLRNIVVDFVMGLFPVVGDVGDFFFRANLRNLHLLKQWAESQPVEGEVIASERVRAAT